MFPLSTKSFAAEVDLSVGKYKIFYEFIPSDHDSPSLMRIKRVDFTTGEVKIDDIDFPEEYFFISHQGNSTQDFLGYASTEDRKTLFTFDFRKKKVNTLKKLGPTEGTIESIYPDSKMYVVYTSEKKYDIYSLDSHKLYYTTKSKPKVFNGRSELKNVPLYLPEPEVGDLIYDGEPRYTYNNGVSLYVYTGGSPIAIKPNGKVVTLTGTLNKQLYKPGYVYKRNLGQVIYKRSVTSDKKEMTELIYPNGTKKTLFISNGINTSFLDQFSPNNKIMISFIATGKDNLAQYRVYEVSSGKLINTFDVPNIRSVGTTELIAVWADDQDNQFRLSRYSPVRYLNAYSTAETKMANAIRDNPSRKYLFTFDTSKLLTNSDPFPIKYNGTPVIYTGQGSFRVMDGTIYTPVNDLMSALKGEVSNLGKETTVSLNESTLKLDPAKIIIWDNHIFYPFKEITSAFKLKVIGKTPTDYDVLNSFAEFEIISE